MNDSNSKNQEPHRRRRCCLCLTIILIIIILTFFIILTLSLTIFRPRHAITTVNSVNLSSINLGLDIPNLSIDLNVTLALNITVFNPNAVSFRYPNGGTAQIYHHEEIAGDAVIPAGEIGAKGREMIDVALTVLADNLIGKGDVYKDVLAGQPLVFQTYTTLGGEVAVLGILKHKLVSHTSCDVSVNVRKRTVENSNCRI